MAVVIPDGVDCAKCGEYICFGQIYCVKCAQPCEYSPNTGLSGQTSSEYPFCNIKTQTRVCDRAHYLCCNIPQIMGRACDVCAACGKCRRHRAFRGELCKMCIFATSGIPMSAACCYRWGNIKLAKLANYTRCRANPPCPVHEYFRKLSKKGD